MCPITQQLHLCPIYNFFKLPWCVCKTRQHHFLRPHTWTEIHNISPSSIMRLWQHNSHALARSCVHPTLHQYPRESAIFAEKMVDKRTCGIVNEILKLPARGPLQRRFAKGCADTVSRASSEHQVLSWRDEWWARKCGLWDMVEIVEKCERNGLENETGGEQNIVNVSN